MAMPEERLQAFLDNQRRESVTSDRFHIENDSGANWALRKIKSLQDKKEANAALAKEEISKINAWLEQENQSLDDSIGHFETLLQEYATRLREKDGKFKSMKLPSGSFGFRKSQPKWEYDSKAVVESLEQHGNHELVRIKKEPDKSAIKKNYKVHKGKVVDPVTGMVLDGVTVTEQPDSFTVKVDE